jgi:hypothetical protein
MRKTILCALALAGALLFGATSAQAQAQTSVSATVVDPLGIPYANGTYSIQLIPSGTNPTVNGNSIGGAFNGSLNASGSFNVSLWPNASIVPAGTTWQFVVCTNPGGIQPPLGTGNQCTPPTAFTISGASQNLSSALSAIAPRLTTITFGSSVSITATSPVVVTPSPITGVGDISCPTCNTGTGSISCAVTGGVPFENGTPDTMACDADLTWDNTDKILNALQAFVGPLADFSLPSPGQLYVITDDGGVLANELEGIEVTAAASAAGGSAQALLLNGLTGGANNMQEIDTESISTDHQSTGTLVNEISLEIGNLNEAGSGAVTQSINLLINSPNFQSTTPVASQIGIDIQDQGASLPTGTNPTAGVGLHIEAQTGKAIIVDAGESDFAPISATTYSTSTSCANGASPAVCAAAPAGAVAVPTGVNPTLVIDTTAVTATSQIILTIDESLTIPATTCNTTLSTLVQPVVTARTPATSFTIQIGATLAANPACVSYMIVN